MDHSQLPQIQTSYSQPMLEGRPFCASVAAERPLAEDDPVFLVRLQYRQYTSAGGTGVHEGSMESAVEERALTAKQLAW